MAKSEPSRRYVPAVWKAKTVPTDSPKVSGGYTTDSKGNVIPARGWNREDQRYELALSEMNTRRDTRAYAEKADTLLLLAEAGSYLLVSKTENRYGVSADLSNCSCPDAARLKDSYPPGQTGTPVSYWDLFCFCKHIRIVNLVLNTPPTGGIPYSVWYVAGMLGIAADTVSAHCKSGDCTATLIKRTYSITQANGDDFITRYRTRIIGAE